MLQYNGSFIGDNGLRKEGWTHHSLIEARLAELKNRSESEYDELTGLLAWAYKQGFLDAAQVLTEAVISIDEAKIRAQLLAGLEELSNPAAPDKP